MSLIFMKVRLYWIFMALISAIGLSYTNLPDGVLIQFDRPAPNTAAAVKIQVCSDTIMRVIASPQVSFSQRSSLIVAASNHPIPAFTVKEQDRVITIATSRLTARVSAITGHVAFYDKDNRLLLREKPDGRTLLPAIVMEEKTFHVRQMFESPEDEAFFGLGQHQHDVMNWKGQNVDLWQYNTVSAVPFLVSNRSYGILWDNNSRTKFGDIRDYQPIRSLTLINKDGQPVGLTAEYFRKSDFTSSLKSCNESAIAHESLKDLAGFAEGFNMATGSIRWSGQLQSDQSGTHEFRFYSSGYAKLWLDDKLVVDSWRQGWAPWMRLVRLDMKAGRPVPIKIEWSPQTGQAYIGLRYLTPSKEDFTKTMSLYSDVADQIDYYFIAGQNLDEVISGYRSLSGKAPMMPKWALGLWQCRERYKSQDELLSVVREFRQRQIPLDNIVQDWFYWPEDKWGDHDFDTTRYPDPEAMVKTLHNDLHTRIMISVWPKFYVGTEHYQQFKEKGWLYSRNVEKQERDWVGRGYVSTFYDAYSEGARKLYWEQMDTKLFSKGFDAWWLDATEPDIHSNLDEQEYLLRIGPTALGTSARYRNTYSLVQCGGIYDGQRQSNPDKRVFILTRSAYAGQQRYSAATWSGDIAARWYDLKAQIPAGLNFCLSGIPYWTTDIGGFAVESRYENAKGDDLDEWREQTTRWFQFGTFCPLFRVHGQFPYREMFNIAPQDHPAYQTLLAYDKLRYRLMPYIYSLAGMVTHQDYTIMRALSMDFVQDKNVTAIDDQFMFGPALMVCPVTEYKARSRQVYLPQGAGWYELKSGKYHTGGQTRSADAPYTDIPLYVKSGSIVPFGPDIQYSDEKPADPVRLFIYQGQDGQFTLYEDENTNYNYEKGAFSLIPIRYEEKTGTVILDSRRGEFPGMLKTRTFEIVWVGPDKAISLDLNGPAMQTATYDGSEIRIKWK